MDLDVGEYRLRNLQTYNVLIGKNGCGKSRTLRGLNELSKERNGYGAVRYLSPERGGVVQYDEGTTNALSTRADFLYDTRQGNQAGQFRLQSAAQFTQLQLNCLLALENDAREHRIGKTFDETVEKINGLLDNIYIERNSSSFLIRNSIDDQVLGSGTISSGEAELLSLSLECLAFFQACEDGKTNLLLMDEPDVHLHPDLQERLVRLIRELNSQRKAYVIVATHSTTMLGAFAENDDTAVHFMRTRTKQLDFVAVDDVLRKILPVFGTHPLSNVLNRKLLLLVEGEDDERIWQQAVRSSKGRIQLYPCPADSKDELNKYEKEADGLMQGIYDKPIAFSLRDRDDDPYEIDDEGFVRRMRLNWRSAENLLLTTEVLDACGLSYDELKRRANAWLTKEKSNEHAYFSDMKVFADDNFDRMTGKIKNVRNVILYLLETNKSWEVLVGQAIADLSGKASNNDPYSLQAALGPNVMKNLVRRE